MEQSEAAENIHLPLGPSLSFSLTISISPSLSLSFPLSISHSLTHTLSLYLPFFLILGFLDIKWVGWELILLFRHVGGNDVVPLKFS